MNVNINGYNWKLLFVDNDDPKMHPDDDLENLGLTEFKDLTISIQKDMPDEMIRKTIIHELVHAFIFSFGYSTVTEEEVCEFFAHQGGNIMNMTEAIMKIYKHLKEGGESRDADRIRNLEIYWRR